MALITFLNSERLALASSKLVYEPDEISSLVSVIDQANKLNILYSIENEKIETSTKAGYESGFEKGQEEGYEKALEHIAVKLVVLAKEATSARDDLEQRVGDLAIKIVEKIATDIGSQQTIAALAKAAAVDLLPREQVILRVHPDSRDYVAELVLNQQQPSTSIVEVISDSELDENDCVLETEFGQVRADLQTQLKVIREKLYGSS